MPGILRRRRLQSESDEMFNNGHDENHSSEGDSRSMIELRSDDFPSYFVERRGRLFSSNPTPYILPVDTPEQEVVTLLVLVLLTELTLVFIEERATSPRNASNPWK